MMTRKAKFLTYKHLGKPLNTGSSAEGVLNQTNNALNLLNKD